MESLPEMAGREWLEWRHQSQTQKFLALLRDSVQGTQQAWSSRAYPTPELNAGALGAVQALYSIIEAIENIAPEQENA